MLSRLLLIWLTIGVLALLPAVATAGPASVPFADDAFQATWERTDQPVVEGVVSGTWMWGPRPLSDSLQEPYAESPNGERLVQYFDKSRMEITNPDGDASSPWYVTNGLLVTEMITGRMQVADGDSVLRFPSETPVAGDPIPRNGPSYATFAHLLDLPGDREEGEEPVYVDRTGELVTERIDWAGVIEAEPAFGEQDVTLAVFDEVTEQNIAEPFWTFMTSSRTVFEDGEYVEASLFENPYFATGRPLTEPYWADVVVAGTSRLVLVQCFERRCLTYTPDNPEGWQVEAGNVGRHYEQWRYGRTEASGTLLFARDDDLFTVNVDGADLRNLTEDVEPAAANSEWSPDGERIVFVGSAEGFDPRGALFVMNADGSGVEQLTDGPLDAQPTWSPDGSSIAFVRGMEGDPEDPFDRESQIFVVDADGTNERQVTDIPPEVNISTSESPSWSPDGQQIAFSHTNGPADLPPMDSTIYLVRPDGSELTALAETQGDGQPQWSPDGQAIVFLQVGGGSADFTGSLLWIINVDGTGLLQLAGGEQTNPREAAWSPDGEWIAFAQSEGLEGTPGQPAGIHLTRPDASERVQLTHFGMWPTWSPDGEHIAFATFGGIVVMDRNGEGLSLVTDNFNPPQWRPAAE